MKFNKKLVFTSGVLLTTGATALTAISCNLNDVKEKFSEVKLNVWKVKNSTLVNNKHTTNSASVEIEFTLQKAINKDITYELTFKEVNSDGTTKENGKTIKENIAFAANITSKILVLTNKMTAGTWKLENVLYKGSLLEVLTSNQAEFVSNGKLIEVTPSGAAVNPV